MLHWRRGTTNGWTVISAILKSATQGSVALTVQRLNSAMSKIATLDSATSKIRTLK